MKYKWGFIFICLIICLFSIASVCAADVNETVVANEDSSEDVITVENQEEINNVKIVENNNQKILENDDEGKAVSRSIKLDVEFNESAFEGLTKDDFDPYFNNYTSTEGFLMSINGPYDVEGNITVLVDNVECYNQEYNGGYLDFNAYDLNISKAGEHHIVLRYLGNTGAIDIISDYVTVYYAFYPSYDLETDLDYEWQIIEVECPNCLEGNIVVLVDGDERYNKPIDYESEHGCYVYFHLNSYDIDENSLNIDSHGYYDIIIKYIDIDYSESIIANYTLFVEGEDEFNANLNIDDESGECIVTQDDWIFSLYYPDYLNGRIVVIVDNEIKYNKTCEQDELGETHYFYVSDLDLSDFKDNYKLLVKYVDNNDIEVILIKDTFELTYEFYAQSTSDYFYDDDINIFIQVPNDITGNLTLNYNDKSILIIPDEYGQTEYIIPAGELKVGSTDIMLILEGDDNYPYNEYGFSVFVQAKFSYIPEIVEVNELNNYNISVQLSSNYTGKLNVYSGYDKEQLLYSADVEYGYASIPLSGFNVGYHFVYVEFEDDDGNGDCIDYDFEIVVNTDDVQVSIPSTVEYGTNVLVKITAPHSDEPITIYVDAIENQVRLRNGEALFYAGILDVGEHKIRVEYYDYDDITDNSSIFYGNFTVIVNPKETTLKLEVNDSVYGENVIVNVTASENGNVSVKIGSIIKNTTVIANQLTSIDFGILEVGFYKVNASFIAGNNYKTSSDTKNIEIKSNLEPIDIEITIPEINSIEEKEFTINLPTDASGTITLTINNENHTFNVINGVAEIIIPNLDNADYPYTITYSGDEKYSSFTINGNITVNKVITTIESENMTIEYGSDYDFKASFFNTDGSPLANAYVVFEVDGEEHMTKTDSYGLAVLKIGLNAGTYAITSVNTRTGETKINTLIVNSIPSQLDSSNVATVYNGGKYLVVILKDINGKPLNGVKLILVLNGKTYTPTTDANGQVKVSTNGLAPKIYTASIIFAGNTNYAKSTGSAKVTVTKATPKITAKAKTFKRTVKTKKYSITLKTNQNKVMKSTKVYIKVNKKTYAAKTNSKGVATFKITKLTKKGRYTAVVTYKGNAYYNKLTKKVKITVK